MTSDETARDDRRFARSSRAWATPGLVVLVSVLGFLLGAFLGTSRALTISCPLDSTSCLTLEELREGASLPQAARIYDREGTLMAEVGGPRRRSVALEQVPERLAQAFVTVEDRRFWSHSGVDSRGVARAVVQNVRSGGLTEGASTIPMQLVRTLWSESLGDVDPWRRKVMEARQGPRLIRELGHDRVLELYLNAIYLGNGIYGVERASRYYFGVGVDELSLGQTATLVGMARAPEHYEPRRYPDRARRVRDVVLRLLAEEGVVEPAEARAAMADELAVTPGDTGAGTVGGRSHIVTAVVRELHRTAPDLFLHEGLEIHTTIDPRVQRAAEDALFAQIDAIEAGELGELSTGAGPGDELPPDDDASRPALEGAAVALDTRTSAVLAWVGGRDFERSQFDRVQQARRQVASLVKPFLVALAMERGYGIIDLVSASREPIPTWNGSWLPADHVLESAIPLREALVRSSNRAAAHLAFGLGMERLADFAGRAGIDGPVAAVPSSAIGTFSASLLDITNAYTLFGNGGARAEPHLIRRIDHWDGRVLRARPHDAGTRVIDAATAFVVLDAMRAVVDRGTGTSVRAHGYEGAAAGKTGTTNDGRDAWFVGLTPEMTAGVWIGFDKPRPIVEDGGGGELAAPVWARWMRDAHQGRPRRGSWTPPLTVERIRYDPTFGDVVGSHCPISPGSRYEEAWVVRHRYDRTTCPSTGIFRRLDLMRRTITPEGLMSLGLRRRP